MFCEREIFGPLVSTDFGGESKSWCYDSVPHCKMLNFECQMYLVDNVIFQFRETL